MPSLASLTAQFASLVRGGGKANQRNSAGSAQGKRQPAPSAGKGELDNPPAHRPPLSPAARAANGAQQPFNVSGETRGKSITSKIKSRFSGITGLRRNKSSSVAGGVTYSNRSGRGPAAKTREAAKTELAAGYRGEADGTGAQSEEVAEKPWTGSAIEVGVPMK